LQYFDVNADQLQPALDRFAQFFAAPLFSESATGRELNAIDSEHAKNINSDGFRLHQVSLLVPRFILCYDRWSLGTLVSGKAHSECPGQLIEIVCVVCCERLLSL
jgi:insulysin